MKSSPSNQVVYSAPAPEVIETFARQVCRELGTEYMDLEIVEGFSAFLKVLAVIQAKHLTKQGQSTEDS